MPQHLLRVAPGERAELSWASSSWTPGTGKQPRISASLISWCSLSTSLFPMLFQPLETFNSLGKDGRGLKVILLHNTNPFHSLSPALWKSGLNFTECRRTSPALQCPSMAGCASTHPILPGIFTASSTTNSWKRSLVPSAHNSFPL